MITLEIDGNREGSESQLQLKWKMLTPDDLHYVKGRHDEWFDRIQRRTGETRNAIEKAIMELFCSHSWHAEKARTGDRVSKSLIST